MKKTAKKPDMVIPKYGSLVVEYSGGLSAADCYCAAEHLAAILDGPLFAVGSEREVAELREEVFHDLCALLARVSFPACPIPNMEFGTVCALQANVLDEDQERHHAKSRAIYTHLLEVVGESQCPNDKTCWALWETFSELQELGIQYETVSAKTIVDRINWLLMRDGKVPMRPDYKTREVRQFRPIPSEVPGTSLKILIVDDDLRKLIRTARALVGWVGVELDFLRYISLLNVCRDKHENSAVDLELARVSRDIVDRHPDIVLMDQGLGIISGSEVIRAMRDLLEVVGGDRFKLPVFVANTGGSDNELQRVGALPNCDGGHDLRSVRDAVRMRISSGR